MRPDVLIKPALFVYNLKKTAHPLPPKMQTSRVLVQRPMHVIRSHCKNIPIISTFLSCLFDVPMKIAAKYLGISSNTLKRVCQREGLSMWPCHELYQERHRTINLRDLFSGRDAMIEQFKAKIASDPKEMSSHIYLGILLWC